MIKVFNKSRSTKLQAHWPPKDDQGNGLPMDKQTLIESLPGSAIDIPDELAEVWLKKFSHIVVTDEEANRNAELTRATIEKKDAEIKELQEKLEAHAKLALEATKITEAAVAKVQEIDESKKALAEKDTEIEALRKQLKKAKGKPDAEETPAG